MTHLGPDEIVDLIEGGLDAGRAGHLDACEACRARAAEVREALAAANEVEAAEPSPLFWEHFPVRVRDAIAAGPAPRLRWAWLTSPAFVLAGACVVAALSVAVVVLRAPATPAPQEAVVAEATAQDDWLDAARDDDVWDLVVAVSASLGWDDATEAGLAIRPGAVDRVLQSLTADERLALVRLLEEELADHM